jgi:hypothetical protein
MTGIELTAAIPEITQGLEYTDDFLSEGHQVQYAPALGVLAVAAGQSIHIAGFHAGHEGAEELRPAISLNERPPEHRSLNDNAKGVGLILGNTLQSIGGRPRSGEAVQREVGLWMTPPLDSIEIIKVDHPNSAAYPVMLQGIARHFYLMCIERLRGADSAVAKIESRYDGANAAIIDPAPRWLLNQRIRRHDLGALPPKWTLYRDRAQRRLTRIATLSH